MCEVEICASALGPAVQSCLMCFPLPARHMAVFFFSSSLRFLPFSLSLSLSFLLSLFLCFFVLFFFQKIKARKGEGSKEKAQERPVQTTQLSL